MTISAFTGVNRRKLTAVSSEHILLLCRHLVITYQVLLDFLRLYLFAEALVEIVSDTK